MKRLVSVLFGAAGYLLIVTSFAGPSVPAAIRGVACGAGVCLLIFSFHEWVTE